MRGGGNMRHLVQQRNILRMAGKFVIADQRAEGRAAEGAVLFFIDFLEDRALIEFTGAFKVAAQILFRHVHDADLQHRAGFTLVHEIMQAAP